ncbi:hypothetical protein BC477_13890 [Clavibacter michiganensis subsp. michiganensis]|nr:hypothetical protein BC477_13890 [Clavibacter michiganensis subsp. michiganensis]
MVSPVPRSCGNSVAARPRSTAAHQRSISLRLARPENSRTAARSRLVCGRTRATATSDPSGTRRPGLVSTSRA